MRIFVRIIQVLVGLLFIISGLVKANDPLGLSYKMQEFFELWSGSLAEGHSVAKNALIHLFEFLHGHSLALAITMIILEVITGVALLLSWRKKFILYLLLVLILFFSFLTGYAYLSGKFTNCGCFGDCFPIAPLTSFLKDIALLLLVLFLIINQKKIRSSLSKTSLSGILAASLLFTLLFQWYVLNYLPLADCLPFKKGNNIAQQMKPKANQLPAIIGFFLSGRVTGTDSTDIVLHQPKAVMLFIQSIGKEKSWMNDLKKIAGDAQKNSIPVYAATSDPETVSEVLLKAGIHIQTFPVDFTLIRMAARTNPTLYILKNGTISNKYSYRKFDNADKDIKNL